MKIRVLNVLIGVILFASCKKDETIALNASFTFRGDSTSTFRIATYDTCTLFNNSSDADSIIWDLGNGIISNEENLVLSYWNSGVYNVKLTVKNRSGQQTSTIKKVIVLDRVLKKIIIKRIFWDTIPNSIPNFNAVWPTQSKADVFVQIQKYSYGDSIVPRSGLLPNSPIMYQSPVLNNISSNTSNRIEIISAGRFVVDKKMILDRSFVISLLARDINNSIYCIQTSLASGVSFGIQWERFPNNEFIVVCNLFSEIELECDFE